MLAALIGWSMDTAWHRMQAQGIAHGFGVLDRATGWQINSPFLDQTADDPYWWTLVVAFVNTLGASAMSIVLACGLGVVIGIGLIAPNRVVAQVFRAYVEIFRNVPLVLQALFWYANLTTLPAPRANPPSLFDSIYVTNQGLFLPSIQLGVRGLGWLWIAALVALCVCVMRRHSASSRLRINAALAASAVAFVVLTVIVLRVGPIVIDAPRMTGFSFQGGWDVPLELIALVLATVLFSAAYIGEIVRGGLQSVPRGLIEAAQALGLPAGSVFGAVRFPIALRSMVPALGNIFLFIVKATAIGSAIGYADVYSISVISISQTGQAVEFLIAMMLIYFVLNYSLTLAMNVLNRTIAFKGNR
ncbi:ABC transporter permease subunit [Burkholderia sp. 22PA0099]|uniref:ABC transporter permease subunit n=1 Tax=Burkholderia sp. 22PA0099 TaxID=3237372 RepID=UPI0039C2BCAF